MNPGKSLFLFYLLMLTSCRPASKYVQLPINWHPFSQTTESDFYQIDSVDNGLILSSSGCRPCHTGCEIKYRSNNPDSISEQTLFAGQDGHLISSIVVTSKKIVFNIDDFDKNTLNTTLYGITLSDGASWEIETPLDIISEFVLYDSFLAVEGSFEGTSQIFTSLDLGKNWKSFNYNDWGYKSVFLCRALPNGKVVCEGFSTYDLSNADLLIVDFKKMVKTKVAHFEGIWYDTKPISKGIALGMIGKNEIHLLKLDENEKISDDRSIEFPNYINNIQTIYADADWCIITAYSDKEVGQKRTWITSDDGKNWHPFYHEQKMLLIGNSMGALFANFRTDEILRGVY